jgi:hypothetical protein
MVAVEVVKRVVTHSIGLALVNEAGSPRRGQSPPRRPPWRDAREEQPERPRIPDGHQHTCRLAAPDPRAARRTHRGNLGVRKPRIAFAVLVEQGGFGGEVAAPVATEIVRRYFDEIAPSERKAPRLGLVRPANLRARGPARLKPMVLRNAPRELSRKTR